MIEPVYKDAMLMLQLVLSTLFVLPYSQAQSYGTVRLWRDNTTSPQYTSGRVQLYTTEWGNVCGDVVFSSFSVEMAGVVCRQLGYLGASSTSTAATDTYEFDPSPTLIDNVNCGSEPENFLVLMRCSFSTFISSLCDDEDDVGVSCYTNRLWDDPFPGMVRLQNGPFSSEGRVQVYCNGVWYTVCGGSSFSVNDADTVCLQLGYKGSGDITEMSTSSSPKFFYQFTCSQARSCINSCQQCPNTSQPIQQFLCTTDAYLQCHYELPFSKGGSERYSCTSDYYPRGEGAIRLALRSLYSLEYTSGRVQVYYNGVWGNVCRLGGFDLIAADVICRQLGWTGALSWSYSMIDDFGEDVRITVLDDISCSSSEFLVLQQCSYATNVSVACSDDDDVSVTCSDVPIWNLPFTGMVRLVGSEFINEGRVEVYCNGEWGTACSNSADASDRRAICRQLGYNQGFSNSAITPGSADSTIPIWLDDLFCFSGSSYNCITDCQMCPGVPSTDIDCQTHDNDLTVQCYISESVSTLSQTLKDCQITVQGVSVEGSLILHRDGIDSSSHTAGIAVLYHDGQWGNICALSPISSREADVICHQMTYTGASSWSIRPDHSFGTDSRDSVIEDMNCSRGSELTVLQCSFTDNINCHDSTDVAVTCYSSRIWDNPFAGMVRLMEGDFTNEGRLEVYCSGQWGTVCDDTFDSNDGGAVCRQLGYDFSHDVDYITLRGDLVSPIWLNDLHCSLDTSQSCINQCQMCPNSVPVFICTHSDDVTVRCSHSTSNRRQYNNGYDRSCVVEPFVPDNPVDGSIILGRGNSYSLQHTSGRVLVRDDLSWGSICRNGVFGNTEADVICHQLTYSGASSWSYAAVDEFGNDSAPFLMTDLQCSDPNLLVIFQCSFNRASTECGRGDEVSVSCYTSRIWDNPFDGMIRLINGNYTNEGLLEVYCNGEWGTVCDDFFGLSGARAACKQLGYQDYSNFNHLTELMGLPSQEIWLDDVDCSSDAECLTGCLQCPSSPDHNCVHSEDVTLQCRAVTNFVNMNLITTCSYSSGPNLGSIIGSTSAAIVVLILLTILFTALVHHKRRNRGNCPNPFLTLAHTSTATIPVTTSSTTTAETNFYSNVQASDIPLQAIPATEQQTPPTFDRQQPPPPYNSYHDSASVHLSRPPPEQQEKELSRENPSEFTIKAPPTYDPSWGVGKPV